MVGSTGAGHEEHSRHDGSAENSNEQDSPDEIIGNLRRELHLEFLGEEPPPWEDESVAPIVDEAAIRSVIRREAPDETAQLVWDLCNRFRSWANAHTKLVAEMARARNSRSTALRSRRSED